MFIKTAEMPGPPPSWWLCYVTVGDMDATIERVNAGGGQVLGGPMEVPGGAKIAPCLDPQGAMFAVCAPAAA